MKAISKKQFQNAVKKVLNGGKCSFIETYETKPFYWTGSKKHMRLIGSEPCNSKYLRNDGRGGKASDVYLVCKLAKDVQIVPSKSEQKAIDKMINEAKKEQDKIKLAKKIKMQEKANNLKEVAKKHGFKSVLELKKVNKEVEQHNSDRMDRAIKNRMEKFNSIHGKYLKHKIQHQVMISKIELEFDCEQKNYFN